MGLLPEITKFAMQANLGKVTGTFRNIVRTEGANGVRQMFKIAADGTPQFLRSAKTVKYPVTLNIAPPNKTDLRKIFVRRNILTSAPDAQGNITERKRNLYTLLDTGKTAAVQELNWFGSPNRMNGLSTSFWKNKIYGEQFETAHKVINGITYKS